MQKYKINELYRKAIHISNIIIPLGYLYIFQEKIEMLMILSFFLILCFFIELARKKNDNVLIFFNNYFRFMMRENATASLQARGPRRCELRQRSRHITKAKSQFSKFRSFS